MILPSDKKCVFNQYLTFKISLADVTTTLYLVYRPPNSHDMAGLINIIKSVPANSVLIGDFNLPSIDWDTGTAGGRAGEFLNAVD